MKWLIDNGNIPEKERSIEITNMENFLNWTILNQPYMVLHELAHAYHHRVLSFEYKPIIKAYTQAINNGLYDSVLYHEGNGVHSFRESYAKTNAAEYFAELTESYLGLNDFYPFNREELKTYDPKGYAIVKVIWLLEEKSN